MECPIRSGLVRSNPIRSRSRPAWVRRWSPRIDCASQGFWSRPPFAFPCGLVRIEGAEALRSSRPVACIAKGPLRAERKRLPATAVRRRPPGTPDLLRHGPSHPVRPRPAVAASGLAGYGLQPGAVQRVRFSVEVRVGAAGNLRLLQFPHRSCRLPPHPAKALEGVGRRVATSRTRSLRERRGPGEGRRAGLVRGARSAIWWHPERSSSCRLPSSTSPPPPSSWRWMH